MISFFYSFMIYKISLPAPSSRAQLISRQPRDYSISSVINSAVRNTNT